MGLLPLPARGLTVGVPVNEAGRWAEIFAAAGCHAYTPPGFYVRRNSRLLMVYSGKGGNLGWENWALEGQVDQSGAVSVTLPERARCVTDVMTGEVLAKDVGSLVLKSEFPRTWLMRLE